MKRLILILIVMLLASCNTSKKVATNKIEVDKSIIEQESTKQEVNESSSVIIVDSSQVDKDIVSEYEINRTTIIKPDSTTIKETIKVKVKSQSKEKKAVSGVKTDSINKTNQEDKLKAKIDTEKKESTKISKKSNGSRIWWYVGMGAVTAVLVWLNKGKISKWLIRFIGG
jgi:hypothetical protein